MTRRKLVMAGALALATTGAVAASGVGTSFIEASDAFATALRESAGELRAAADFDSVFVLNAAAQPVVGGIADPATGNGLLAVGNAAGIVSPIGLKVIMQVSPANSGVVLVANSAGTGGFLIDGNTGLSSGSADLAEAFSATTPDVAPGTVMVIDPEQEGRLAVSSLPHDRRVVGVVAGANDYPSAITLAGLAEKPNKVAVTLTGTVYARVSAENGPVRAGDLLTTAKLPGHAMRVTDYEAARGSILGKALEDLDGETGMVLVLANLQ